jgi:hypothetical protein
LQQHKKHMTCMIFSHLTWIFSLNLVFLIELGFLTYFL